MKNLKLFFSLLMFVGLIATGCQKDNFYEYEDDYNDEWIDDDGDDVGGNSDQEGMEGSLSLYEIINGTIIKIKDFSVSSNLKSFQTDTEKHGQMWDFFKKLIPDHDRRFITEFEVFHGGGGLLGYVAPIDYNDLSRWRMGLAIDAAVGLDRVLFENDFTYTCIHEYGHVLTLNDLQVDASSSDRNCANYHTGEGCSGANSYINKIVEIGWADILDEHNQINPDDGTYEFYEKYSDRFVTEYAATNPGEDVAEVFTTFVVMDEMPRSNSIADQKVSALYDFPELVELRDEIRKQPVARAMTPGSWVKKGKKHKCSRHAHGNKKAKAKAF